MAFILIDSHPYPIDSDCEMRAAAALLFEHGIASTPVWHGEQDDPAAYQDAVRVLHADPLPDAEEINMYRLSDTCKGRRLRVQLLWTPSGWVASHVVVADEATTTVLTCLRGYGGGWDIAATRKWLTRAGALAAMKRRGWSLVAPW